MCSPDAYIKQAFAGIPVHGQRQVHVSLFFLNLPDTCTDRTVIWLTIHKGRQERPAAVHGVDAIDDLHALTMKRHEGTVIAALRLN